MRIKSEGSDFVELELTADEAGRVAADILAQQKISGETAVAVAQKLENEGLYSKPAVPHRMEWVGPDDVES